MGISPKTTISQLLDAHPFLLDYLVAYNPRFELLKNKVMRATMGKMATLERVAGNVGIPLDTLMKDIAVEIKAQTGEAVEVEAEAGPVSAPDPEKTAALKAILLELHDGAPFDDLKKRFDELIEGVEPMEIVAMEQELIKEGGIPIEEVKRLSDLHVNLFKDVLGESVIPVTPDGHPVHTFIEENKVLTSAVADLDLLLQQLKLDSSPENFTELSSQLKEALDTLSRVEIHYQRKENQLFPFLEEHGITAPPQVMWAVHDDIRAKIKRAIDAFESQDLTAFIDNGAECGKAIGDMVYKEEHILFPISMETLDEANWVAIRKGEQDIGYAFTEPAADWPGAEGEPEVTVTHAKAALDTGQLELDTGQMTLDQINLMLKHLPVDITFVDEEDRVRYFSATDDRLFPRSPGIIGRNVQNCHPPKSLDVVNRIVGEFKAGTKDNAAFWIQLGGRFIYIRYFAVRDDEGAYCGTVEVSQDITEIKTIEGQNRLLDWDNE